MAFSYTAAVTDSMWKIYQSSIQYFYQLNYAIHREPQKRAIFIFTRGRVVSCTPASCTDFISEYTAVKELLKSVHICQR